MYYLEHSASIDDYHLGTREHGEAIGKQALSVNIILMRHHGVLVFDESFADATMWLEAVEMTCRMVVEAHVANIQLKTIDLQTVEDFMMNANYKRVLHTLGEARLLQIDRQIVLHE